MTASAGDTFPLPIAAQKSALRSLLRERRRAIDAAGRRRAARLAARALLRALRRSRRVAVYLSVRSELPTGPLIEGLLAAGVEVYLPRTLRDSKMDFVPLRLRMPLRRGALGLMQPVSSRGQRPVAAFDAIVIPLLGFDSAGRRLGNGGGYYDRALMHAGRRPWRVGYAFSAQQVEALPEEPWDIRLQAVVTEHGVLSYHSAARNR